MSRRFLIVAVLNIAIGLALVASSHPQKSGDAFSTFNGAPSGACVSSQSGIDSSTGDFWTCSGGVWRQVTFPLYSTTGTLQTAHHIVMGKASLVGGTVTVTLSGKAVFSSSSSYVCSLADSTGLNLTAVSYVSGSQFTITGVLTDQVSFVCVGN
jgi:hypothetical protein